MPVRPSKNVTGKYIELPSELAAEVDKFAEKRGESFKAVVVDALRRHMAYPPPPPVPVAPPPLPPITPLPPVTASEPDTKKPTAKTQRKKK
jgi:hypothetical protein